MPILLVRRAPQPPPEETDPYATYEVGGVPVDAPDYVRSSDHTTAGHAAATNVVRRDSAGSVDAGGKIGIIGIGMSNAEDYFAAFKTIYDASSQKADGAVFVECARRGESQETWRDASKSCWSASVSAVTNAGMTAAQVQIVLCCMIQKSPKNYGNLTASGLDEIATNILSNFPNVKLMLGMPIGYTGYGRAPGGNTTLAPVAAMYADALFWQTQVETHTWPGSLWVDMLHVWANGTIEHPLVSGLDYLAEDLAADGVHPSIGTGDVKVANLLWAQILANPVLENKVWKA